MGGFRWYCCKCGDGPLNSLIIISCPNCGHFKDSACSESSREGGASGASGSYWTEQAPIPAPPTSEVSKSKPTSADTGKRIRTIMRSTARTFNTPSTKSQRKRAANPDNPLSPTDDVTQQLRREAELADYESEYGRVSAGTDRISQQPDFSELPISILGIDSRLSSYLKGCDWNLNWSRGWLDPLKIAVEKWIFWSEILWWPLEQPFRASKPWPRNSRLQWRCGCGHVLSADVGVDVNEFMGMLHGAHPLYLADPDVNEAKFLCNHKDCNRSRPGSGFKSQTDLEKHKQKTHKKEYYWQCADVNCSDYGTNFSKKMEFANHCRTVHAYPGLSEKDINEWIEQILVDWLIMRLEPGGFYSEVTQSIGSIPSSSVDTGQDSFQAPAQPAAYGIPGSSDPQKPTPAWLAGAAGSNIQAAPTGQQGPGNIPIDPGRTVFCCTQHCPKAYCKVKGNVRVLQGADRNDRTFFQKLNTELWSLKSRWNFLSLSEISGISFVKFYKLRYDDIKQKEFISASKSHDVPLSSDSSYEYVPLYKECDYEILRTCMLHYLNSPECASTGTDCLAHIPKHIGSVGKWDKGFGWGLMANEAPAFWKIMLLMFLCAAPVPLWLWRHPGDLQNAFMPLVLIGMVLGLRFQVKIMSG